MSGGDDADTFIVGPGDGNDTIDGGEGGTDNDTLIVTGPGHDHLWTPTPRTAPSPG